MKCREGLGARSGVSRKERLGGEEEGRVLTSLSLAWLLKVLEDPPEALGFTGPSKGFMG